MEMDILERLWDGAVAGLNPSLAADTSSSKRQTLPSQSSELLGLGHERCSVRVQKSCERLGVMEADKMRVRVGRISCHAQGFVDRINSLIFYSK